MKMNKRRWRLFMYVLSVILIIASFKLVFDIAPTSTETANFLAENGCSPSATETNSDEEYPCAYYLRRRTATIFGQIINFGFPLSATNPFGSFYYDPTPGEWGCALSNSCKNDEHFYVFVVTRDKGPLVYNPVNGEYVGNYNNLMSRMGCGFKVDHYSAFSSQFNKAKLGSEAALCYSNSITKDVPQ